MKFKECYLCRNQICDAITSRGMLRINPLPQDKDRNIEKNVDEQFEAQEHGL